jgi:hypothetical protein
MCTLSREENRGGRTSPPDTILWQAFVAVSTRQSFKKPLKVELPFP